MRARIALICGFYKRRSLVARTLKGLHRQTARDATFFVFDDGSSDGTYEEIQRVVVELGDPRFVVERHEHNMGLTKGLIQSIERTESDYVAIHDAGDYSDPRRLERQADELDRRPDLVVVGSHYINYIEGAGINVVRTPQSAGATLASLVHDTTFTHGEVMFRRSAYVTAGGYRPQFRYAQDNDLWLRMSHLGAFYTVPEVLYVRCIQSQGISYSPDSFVQQSAFLCLGRKIAVGEVENAALDRIPQGSVFDVVPKSSAPVQKVLVRGALRAIALGQPQTASAILKNHIDSRPMRIALKVAAGLASMGAARHAYRAAWTLAGYYRPHGLVSAMLTDSVTR